MAHPRTPFSPDAITLLDDSLHVLSAAARFAQHAKARGSAGLMPSSLGLVEEALYALGRGCEHAASALLPPGDMGESVSQRFALAAAGWPALTGGGGPSHERLAELLNALGETRDALRVAAERCGAASAILESTLAGPETVGGSRRSSAAIA
jgi:hypothetical protein